jgi:IS1 family transposase/transposase-like protein
MNKHEDTQTRPPLETLACVNEQCEWYGQKGQDNLTVRKTYGQDEIRYLRCQHCGTEFSERKNTALWNTKVSETRAVAVAEHLAEGCSLKAASRLAKVDVSVVRRLNRKVGEHGEAFHDEQVQDLTVTALEADERHGYAHDKGQPQWEAELIDPESKFIVSHVQGSRDEALIRHLLEDGANRLANRHQLVLLTDGEASYASLFPEIFGQPYRPARQGSRGRFPGVRYRIPRTLAHVQIIKHREGRRVVDTEVRYTHGSRTLVHETLDQLGYAKPNTSAIERRNGTARLMSAHQVRRSLAFSRRSDTKVALGWWGVTVYNWCRLHRSLRLPLAQPQGKKSSIPKHPRWRWGLPIVFGRSVTFSSLLFSHQQVGDNLTSLPTEIRRGESKRAMPGYHPGQKTRWIAHTGLTCRLS